MDEDEMTEKMGALKERLRIASDKNVGMRLNNQEVAWIDSVVNNGYDIEETTDKPYR